MVSGEVLVLLMLILSILAIMAGVPIAFALGGSAMIFGIFGIGASVIKMYVLATISAITTYEFIAVGLFIFMGSMLESSGIAERMFDTLYVLMGKFRGGLAAATMIISIFFGACSGVIGASIVTMSLVALPSMISKGYNKSLAAGTVMAGGNLGLIIPPSIMLILYGSIAGTSIPKLFAAGMLPGILLGLMYVSFIVIVCYIKPEYGPAMSVKKQNSYFFSVVNVKSILTELLPVMILIFLVLGSIFVGICAPTEAAGLGGLGGILLCIAYRKFSISILGKACLATVKTVAMIIFIVLGAKYFIATFQFLGGDEIVQNILSPFLERPNMLLIILLGTLLILGMFMDWIGLVYVFVPMLNPIISKLGFDPVWYGMLFCLTLCISVMTPPFAYAVFYLKGVASKEMTIMDMYKGCLPFLAFQIIIVVLVYELPGLVTWLPNILIK